MVLVDTSIWVEHFRHGREDLRSLLEENQVYCHPFIIGELACGHLKNRSEILSLLASIQQSLVSEDEEILEMIEANGICGRGVGWIDVHLLSSALLSGARLLTLDRKLKKIAQEFSIAY